MSKKQKKAAKNQPGRDTIHEGLDRLEAWIAGHRGGLVIVSHDRAFLERAVTSGFLAANHLLAPLDVRPEPIRCIPLRGLFAGRARRPAAAEAAR